MGVQSDIAKTSTEALLETRKNLLKGLGLVGEHIEKGTFKLAVKEGSAPPSEAGWLILTLLLDVEDELESRILGFERAVDPRMLKV